MTSKTSVIDLLGTSFAIRWQSPDGRKLVIRKKCYELVSFDVVKSLDEYTLKKAHKVPLVKIEKCWIPNPNYKRDASREYDEWNRATGGGYDRSRGDSLPETRGYYCPPESRGLRFIDPRDVQISTNQGGNETASMVVDWLIKDVCGKPVSGPLALLINNSSGFSAFLATFRDGGFAFLQDLAECPIPSEAEILLRLKALDNKRQRINPRPLYSRGRTNLGRLSYTRDFDDVWLDNDHYDLRTRKKARFCIQYLVQKKALGPKSARHLRDEIDPFVRQESGDLPPSAEIKIQHYFTGRGSSKRLPTLCKKLIRAAGRNGRYYLAVE